MTTTRSGYADVNGIRLYHEIYGEGEPFVLIHKFLADPMTAGQEEPRRG